MSKQILVVAAIIHYDQEFLIVQRSLDPTDLQPGLWEFPGGKIEYGEDPKHALKREIKEELALDISNLEVYDVTSGMLGDLHAVMILYSCKSSSKNLTLKIGNDYRWIQVNELENFEFAELDVPVIERMILGL